MTDEKAQVEPPSEERLPEQEAAGNSEGTSPATHLWLQATHEDIECCDINAPVAAVTAPTSYAYETAYREALEREKGEGDDAQSRRKVFSMLASIMGMHGRRVDSSQPFGPKIVLSNGNRSPEPEDFRGAPVAVIARAAERATHPVVRARLADLAWLLERKRGDMARIAVESYTETVERLASGKLVSSYSPPDSGPFCSDATDALKRALNIGWQIGWDKGEVLGARELVARLRPEATAAGKWGSFRELVELDLRYGISSPAELAEAVESSIAAKPDEFLQQMAWRLAASAHNAAGNKQAENRCLIAAADSLIRQADHALDVQKSAMHASHWLGLAIAQLHGLKGVKDKRAALRHRLIDVQEDIPDEMGTFSTPFDFREIAEFAQKNIDGLGLKDMLFYFATMGRIPDSVKLVADARESIAQFPLSSLFGSSHHDMRGKVVHRTEPSHEDAGDDSSAIASKISQAEGIRRHVYSVEIDVVRRYAITRYHISKETFQSFLRHSEFVPGELVNTYSRGFARFFEGDFTSAIYILTPLLEASVRHVLRNRGYDVTKFDDATQIQQDLTISALFDQKRGDLDDVFGSTLTAEMARVFLDHPGPRIRHDVAHGLLHDGSPFGSDAQYACWFLFKLCCIPLQRFKNSIRIPE